MRFITTLAFLTVSMALAPGMSSSAFADHHEKGAKKCECKAGDKKCKCDHGKKKCDCHTEEAAPAADAKKAE